MGPTRIAFGLILGIHGGLAFAAQWTPASAGLVGSPPRVGMLVIDRVTGSTLYALAANSIYDVFKSVDAGASWKALTNITRVSALALDPTTASTVYAGTGGGLLKSTDGGDSWAPTGLAGVSVSILAINPITPSTLYAAGGPSDTVYRSTNGGASWTAVSVGPPPGPLTGILSLTLDPVTPSTLYVVVNSSPDSYVLYNSTDAGQSWNVASPGLVRLLAIAPTTPSTLYAIHDQTGFSISTDGGATWTATGFTQDVRALAIDSTNPKTMYAAASLPSFIGIPPASTIAFPPASAIFQSTDGGQSWIMSVTAIPAAGSLVISHVDSSTIYAATVSGVFKTTSGIFWAPDGSPPGSLPWSAANTGLSVFDIPVLVGDPLDPATLYAGGSQGLFKTVDGGGSWSQLATFESAVPVPGYPPGVLPPNSGLLSPAPVTSLLIDFANPNILYAATDSSCYRLGSNLHKSTDGGASWSHIGQNASDCGPLMAMDPTNPNTLYLRNGNDYDGYGLRKSTNGGASWVGVPPGQLNGLSAVVIDPTTPAILYAATDSTSPEGSSTIGGVQKSTDGGATWDAVGLPNQDVSLLAIDPLQPNILYAGVSDYADGCCFRGLFKSDDSGASWSPINNGLGELLGSRVNVNALILDPDHPEVLYLGTSGYGVFKSSDGGTTWTPFNDGLTFLDVRVLAIARGATPTVYAGTPGGVFKIVEQTELGTLIRNRGRDAKKQDQADIVACLKVPN